MIKELNPVRAVINMARISRIFKEIEKPGGFLNFLKNGRLRNSVKNTIKALKDKIETVKETLMHYKNKVRD